MEYRLGIVLSGGGTRGVAHIGVLEALRENDIEVDCVSATSSGALVGAMYAAGYSAEETLELFRSENPFRLSKFALGKPGFIDTDKIHQGLARYFPDDSFEALGKKLFLTATDIVGGRCEIFASGPLVRPMVASGSIPLVFTPTELQGRWFLDGGILNNFPVEPLTGLCDVILGVYASPLRPVKRSMLKSSLDITQRALELGMYSSSRQKFHHCDVLLCPPELCRFGAFETKNLEEILEIGYRAASERLDDIRERLELIGQGRLPPAH